MSRSPTIVCPHCFAEHYLREVGAIHRVYGASCPACRQNLYSVQSPSGPKDADPTEPGGSGRVLSLDEAVAIARRNTPEPQLYRVDVRVITLPMLIVAALYAFAMASLAYIVLF